MYTARMLAAALLAAAMVVAGCGDSDDEPSAQDEFCQAGEDLRSAIGSFGELDLLSEGTSGVTSRLEEADEALGRMRESGREVAADEIEALETAVDELQAAIEALGDDGLSRDSLGEIGSSVQAVTSRGADVFRSLDEACP